MKITTIPTRADLLKIKVAENGEDFTQFNGVTVRKTVAEKLATVKKSLKAINTDYELFIFEGYRSLEKQRAGFGKALTRCNGDAEAAHTQSADPTVAGHPTGGAVDVAIRSVKTGELLDFGCGRSDWAAGEKIYTNSPLVTDIARQNRDLLCSVMTQQGFVNYPLEWWHFSYGDREWAAITGNDTAIYSQQQLKK
jgi:D-alanyl-D-alanine dipeptidase